ncbi:PDR/VanB family oxidoreductase [Amycolatopsis sp. FDAARGOS 1241]|uniref:PDR/VanB family oxidoreductase n=1 Tax=Amycolatopsis sp. FDAARGOS 1241 TaxID=2778070 RepID=UPI001951E87B|nr:PDR/VanB family oxidoreductase [Amycolatopsis sp. FDAARGOS 1241]QRP43646.1 oxidoreductase [Amycolatopsis sp. FDAARGOS 1241]
MSVATDLELDVVLAAKEHLADGVVRLTLRDPAGAALPAWAPGAHLDLVLGPDLVRQYSLCGDPADRSVLQVAVLREPAGRGGSAHVHEKLAGGETLRVRGPRNHFALEPAPRYLFVAGGIGITPLVPMIAAAEAAGAEWRLLYGGRTRASMAFAEELRETYGDRVELVPQDERGLLDLDAALAAAPDAAVYCCGPEPLLAAMEQRCAPGSLHVERFTAKPDTEPKAAFEVQLAQSGRTLEVPADRSILSVVEESGVPVLSSCHEGTCGTCETGVLEGTPDHRDAVLTAAEREAGDVMMICVSRCAGARLVLDL